MGCAIVLSPALEVRGKFAVGNNVNFFDTLDWSQIVDHPFHHRLSRHIEQRFRFILRQRVKACCVTGSENEDVHAAGITRCEPKCGKWKLARRPEMSRA